MSKIVTNEDFIKRSIDKHGNKYDYSEVSYINMRTNVNIICPNHGVFKQKPDAHLHGKGCRFCVNKPIYKHNKISFIELSIQKHGNKYNYSKVNYLNNKTKVIIICPLHGEFRQTPNLHLSGSGCQDCYYDSLRSDNNKFILKSIKIHGNRYDYSRVNYISSNKKVEILCKKHGPFKQSPSVHLSGCGCKECMKESFRVDFDIFIKKSNELHNNKYFYYKETFSSMRRKMKIKCPIHGDFYTTPDNHISKLRGCVKCSNNVSKMETKWLNDLLIEEKLRQSRIRIGKELFKFDAFDPIKNIVYEFYGDFWHGNPDIYQPHDFNPINGISFGELYRKTIEREIRLKSLGYKVISIWENDFLKSSIVVT